MKAYLRVFTDNLWGLNDWERRIEGQTIVLQKYAKNRRYSPYYSFVAVQEANLSTHPNTLLDLAFRLGFTADQTVSVPGTGVGFFTNGEIRSTETIELPDDKDHPQYFGRRVGLMATVAFLKGSRRRDGYAFVDFLCTHLTVNPEMQTRQVEVLLEATDSRVRRVVLVGDFNAGIDTEAYYKITERAGFIDALLTQQSLYRQTWPVNPAWYDSRPGNDWYRIAMSRWVDHIFYKNLRLIRSWSLGRKMINGVYPSDHSIQGAEFYLPLTP